MNFKQIVDFKKAMNNLFFFKNMWQWIKQMFS